MKKRRNKPVRMKSTAGEPLGGAGPLDVETSEPTHLPKRTRWGLWAIVVALAIGLLVALAYVANMQPYFPLG